MWVGDPIFVLENLILKDFRIRYRNMSLGVLWSVVNPIVMMGVLTFIFTKIFPNQTIKNFPVFLLCGLVPYNFFSVAWISGTTSVVDSAGLVKRVPMPRVIVPIAAVLSNCLHLLIQMALLLFAVLAFGGRVNSQWLWLPVVWILEIVFVCGLAMISSAMNVYIRDTRYLVESANTVLFWLVPIFYSLDKIPPRFNGIYQLNPVAALVLCLRNILLAAAPPHASTFGKLTVVSLATFAIGFLLFQRLKNGFFDHI
jgi:lipopolysaccharide transport system permease protein